MLSKSGRAHLDPEKHFASKVQGVKSVAATRHIDDDDLAGLLFIGQIEGVVESSPANRRTPLPHSGRCASPILI